MTPIVRAVKAASPSVVNIQGQKTVAATDGKPAAGSRQVNGMGTGIVIDPRGYILTNHHVVDGVRQINVALDSGRVYTARLVAHDRRTDLAVIKVNVKRPLPTAPIGRSADLMPGEPVIAVGNAFGYEHTVTRGIISALHRDVQVSDTQSYEDLIQTDASINPGNSGGPLLSIEGKMVGVNVAVRAGAQGIGFAIPVDKAMAIAAQMMSVERLENRWHGLETASTDGDQGLMVRRVLRGSPAAASGLRVGDVISRINDRQASRSLDVELGLLGRSSNRPASLEVQRDGKAMQVQLALAPKGRSVSASRIASVTRPSTSKSPSIDDDAWEILGLAMTQEADSTFSKRDSKYRGGMRVTKVRRDGPADKQGIKPGDVLVGMHRWETASEQDIRYIVTRSNLESLGPVRFYILRGDDTLFGTMSVASRPSSSRR